jgi:hypothetical protein
MNTDEYTSVTSTFSVTNNTQVISGFSFTPLTGTVKITVFCSRWYKNTTAGDAVLGIHNVNSAVQYTSYSGGIIAALSTGNANGDINNIHTISVYSGLAVNTTLTWSLQQQSVGANTLLFACGTGGVGQVVPGLIIVSHI